MTQTTPFTDFNLEAFASAITAQVQKHLANKAQGKKPTLLKAGGLDNLLAAKARQTSKTQAERLDAYATWVERSKVLYYCTQECLCCKTQSTFVGAIFIEVFKPGSTSTKAYIRRETTLKLPLRIEYDSHIENIPFCAKCIEQLTQPIDAQTAEALTAEYNQLQLF